jgi:hypothetical protein
MMAWGNYTQDGNTIFAHNFDYRPFYRNFNDLNVLVAYHPNDGSNSLITMCQAGQITAPIFWITKELAASANDGSSNGGDNIVANRIAWPFTLFEHLLDAQNLRAYEHRINSSNTNFSCIPYAADKARGIAFDWSVYGSKKRPETTPNLHIMINDFTHPDWNFIKAVDDPATLDFAKRRRAMNNLITRFAPFNIQDYKDLFSTPMIESYNSPGVTVSKKLSNKPSVTLIQCITTPGRDDLWLRMPEYIDEWQHIDLKWLLN